MAQNNKPIFVGVPSVQWGTAVVATANTAMDGTGTVLLVFTADATNGSYVQKLNIRHAGTNIATLLRIFINNGSTNATALNNILYGEVAIAANTVSQTAAASDYSYPLNIALPAGYKINVTVGTTVAAGLYVSGVGGNY